MRDFYQVLHEKELEVLRVREEIAALRSIIPLLEEEGQVPRPIPCARSTATKVAA